MDMIENNAVCQIPTRWKFQQAHSALLQWSVLPRIRHFLNGGSDVGAQIYGHPSHHNLIPLDLLLCGFMKDIIYRETVKHLWDQTTHHKCSSKGKKTWQDSERSGHLLSGKGCTNWGTLDNIVNLESFITLMNLVESPNNYSFLISGALSLYSRCWR